MTTTATLCIAASAIVIWRTITAVSSINIEKFNGHPLRFIGLAAYWSMLGAGSLSVLIGLWIASAPVAEAGAKLLVVGMAVLVLTDRRRNHHG